MSKFDASNHHVSVVVVIVVVVIVVVVGMNYFGFSTSFLEPLHEFPSIFVWMFLWWTPTKCVKISNFVQILTNS